MSIGFRDRIAGILVLSASVLLAVVFVVLYQTIAHEVFSHLDSDLEGEVAEVQKSMVVLSDSFVVNANAEWREREHRQLDMNPIFLEVLDAQDRVVATSDNLFDNRIPYLPDGRTPVTRNDAFAGEQVRVLQTPVISTRNTVIGHILAAIPRRHADLTLYDLRMLLFILYAGSLAAMFIISRTIAGRGISPVNRIIAAAAWITKENLSTRIPSPKSRDELHTLVATINELLERLDEGMTRERQFTANAAHELRTPLAAIKGTLEVLLLRPRDTAHYERKIAECIGEVNRLAALVDRLLVLARLDAMTGVRHGEPVAMNALFTGAVRRLEPLARSKNIAFTISGSDGTDVVADRSMLEMMADNILSNAIKYSTDGGQVEVDIARRDGEVRCTVTDHGPGMTAEQQERLYDRFYRGEESRASNVPGFGLGMSIVKRLAEIQNLRIDVSSHPGSGTRVVVAFPLPSLRELPPSTGA